MPLRRSRRVRSSVSGNILGLGAGIVLAINCRMRFGGIFFSRGASR